MIPGHHVVFGAGPLGRATCAALLALGAQVILVNRSGAMQAPPSGARIAAADLLDADAIAALCRGASAIHFCAQPPYHRWRQDFIPLLDAAIAAAHASGARLVVADNMYGYGEPEQPISEFSPLMPVSRKGQVRALMNEKLLVAHAEGRIEFASARACDFFGPWVLGSAVGLRLFKTICKGGTAALAGDPDQPHSFTFVEDFGHAMAILGTEARGANQVWHVPNAPAVTSRQFVEIAFRLAGRRPRMRVMSALELRLAGLFIPPARETIEMLYQFDRPFVADHAKFARTFGDISTPLQSALARTLDWVRLPR